jgi:hypothetical protein
MMKMKKNKKKTLKKNPEQLELTWLICDPR